MEFVAYVEVIGVMGSLIIGALTYVCFYIYLFYWLTTSEEWRRVTKFFIFFINCIRFQSSFISPFLYANFLRFRYFESPLEELDPYIIFRDVFTGLQQHNPASYNELTKATTPEQQEFIMNLIKTAEENVVKAAEAAAKA